MSAAEDRDLARHAGALAAEDMDLYALLGVDALTPRDAIHRAWRKASLRHHPDKAGASYDADKWKLFERARDILSDEGARAVYDQGMRAKALRQREREAMDRERRFFADDLEARERAARQARDDQAAALQRERDRLAALERARDDEARAAQHERDLAEARRRVQQRKQAKALRKQEQQQQKRQQKQEEASSTTTTTTTPLLPANGAVRVPGDYVAGGDDDDDDGGGGGRRLFYQLVGDKLRAVQALRTLQRDDEAAAAAAAAEQRVREVRQRIHAVEAKYQAELGAV